jgi:hypothetical protein
MGMFRRWGFVGEAQRGTMECLRSGGVMGMERFDDPCEEDLAGRYIYHTRQLGDFYSRR